MQKTRTLADVKADLDAKVMEGNKAITENQPLTIAYFDGFAILEKEFADLTAEQVYTELMTEEVPMIAAIKRYSFQVVRHQEVRDSKTKEMTEIKLVEKDKFQIVPTFLCSFAARKKKFCSKLFLVLKNNLF